MTLHLSTAPRPCTAGPHGSASLEMQALHDGRFRVRKLGFRALGLRVEFGTTIRTQWSLLAFGVGLQDYNALGDHLDPRIED